MDIKKVSFKQFLELAEGLSHLPPPSSALKDKPTLVDKENPLNPNSYKYKGKWKPKLGTKASQEHHAVERDVTRNKERLAGKPKAFVTLKNYLTAKPPRG